MQDFTFVIPVKYENVSLPIFLKDIFKNLKITSENFTYCVVSSIKDKRYEANQQTISLRERDRIGGLKKINALKDGLLILFKMVKMSFIK